MYSQDNNFPTLKKYFNNNGKGYDKPHIIKAHYNDGSIDHDLKLDIRIYYHNIKDEKWTKIDQEVKSVINNFFKLVEPNIPEKNQLFELYIFDDKADYKELGREKGLGNEGGKQYYCQDKDGYHSEIFVFQRGDVFNLQHEIVHALCCYAVNHRCDLNDVLTEGIADFIANQDDPRMTTLDMRIDEVLKIIKDKNFDMSNVLALKYSDNPIENSMVYTFGHTLVAYLQDKTKGQFLKELFHSCLNKTEKEFISGKINDISAFSDWLDENAFEKSMAEFNALKIVRGDKIATVNEIINDKEEEVDYYDAKIIRVAANEEVVGNLSAVSQHFFFGDLRTTNMASRDYIDIGDENFHNLKLVKHDDQYKFTYCNAKGEEYKDANKDYLHLDSLIRNKYSNDDIAYKKILDGLIYFDSKIIPNIDLDDCYHNNKVFAIKPTITNEDWKNTFMHKTFHAASIYDENNNKITEIKPDVGYFRECNDYDDFIYQDVALNLYTSIPNDVYIGVEDDKKVASFIQTKRALSDDYHDTPHIHRDGLINVNIKNIDLSKDCVLRGVKFLDDHRSEKAQYSEFDKHNKDIVVPSLLLDDKGSETKDDDIYGAQILHDGKKIYEFNTMGFYISNEGDLMMHDHSRNVRFQLPKEITHLKFVKHDGLLKFVPCTKDGDEFPKGMPDGMSNSTDVNDEFRYITPLSAHKYEKFDYKYQKTNLGLIDFSQYIDLNDDRSYLDKPIFRISPDMNSKEIFTEVKLFYCPDYGEEEEIGMLSNELNQFRDDIFFSLDYNYSYNDFLASVSPNLKIEKQPDDSYMISFDVGIGDVGNNNTGFTDHYKIYADDLIY